jgi:hypothetical protein
MPIFHFHIAVLKAVKLLLNQYLKSIQKSADCLYCPNKYAASQPIKRSFVNTLNLLFLGSPSRTYQLLISNTQQLAEDSSELALILD